MSNIKKMKLVPYTQDDNKLREVINSMSISSSPYLKGASNLDLEINQILDSNENERNKALLYAQALKKFLTYKGKYETEIADKEVKLSDYINEAVQNILPELTKTIQGTASSFLKTKKAIIKPRIRVPPKRKTHISISRVILSPSTSSTPKGHSIKKKFQSKKTKKTIKTSARKSLFSSNGSSVF